MKLYLSVSTISCEKWVQIPSVVGEGVSPVGSIHVEDNLAGGDWDPNFSTLPPVCHLSTCKMDQS